MRLQELKTKEAVQFDEAMRRSVRLFLQSSFYDIDGGWNWEMETEVVFCSDVMLPFPADFEGTKGIVHPDDLSAVKEKLGSGETISSLTFRIITTYGEVKRMAGSDLVVQKNEQLAEALRQQPLEAVMLELEQKAASRHYSLLRELNERTERFTGAGTWYYNTSSGQTWYSDFIFHLHGLPAQSLNAHLHTFHVFIHPEDALFAMEFMDKAFAEKTPLHMEYRVVAGEVIKWVSYKTQWFSGSRGEAVLGGILQDITEQKAAERELEAHKALVQFQRQQLLYDEQQAAFGHWQINLLTRKASYSDHYYRIFGLKPHSVAPTMAAFLNYVHPDDRDRVETSYKKIIYEHDIPEMEYRIIRLDGKPRYILQKAKILMYEGEMIVSGIIQDVTVQRMLEKKGAGLQETIWKQNMLAQQAAEMANLASWIVDIEENTYTWSESFFRLMGYQKVQPQNMTEKTLFTIIHPHDLKEFRNHWYKAAQQNEPASFNFRILQKGSVYYMKAVFSHYTNNEKTYFIGTVQDNTTEQVLQQQLSQRVQMAESLMENIQDRVMITDTDNTILLWNKACEQAYGIRKAEAVGQNFFDVFPGLKTEQEMQRFQQVYRGERLTQEGIFSLTGNGHYNLFLVPLYQGAEVTGILHVIHDVTKEVDLRKSLNERLQLIESIVQSSVDRIIALDRNMNYIYWNRKAEEYYRLTKEEVLGKNILDVFPQMVNDPSYVEIRRALKGETIHLAADPRNEKYFETYLVPIKGERGEVTTLLWVAHDLTKEWQLEQERRRVQAQVEEEHRRLKEAQAIGRLGSFEWTVGEPVTHWSDELYYINGLEPRSEVITLEKVDQFIHPDDFEEVQALKEKSFLQAGDYSLVHRIVRRDGEVRWVNHMWESIADATGKIIKVVGVVQDITERHKAQYAEEQLKDFNLLLKQQVEERTLALQESKQLIEEITLTTPDLITIHDVTTNTIIYSNHENYWKDFFDTGVIYTLNDEQQAAAMIHPDDLKKGTDFMEERRLLQDNEMKEVELKMKPGRYVRIRSKIFKRDEKGQATQIISFTTDITKHKKAEEEVQKNLTILKQAEDIAAIGSWEYQIPSGRFSWSDGMYRIFDYPMGAPVNPDIYVNQAVEEDRGIAKRIVKNLRKTHQPMEETVRIHREDGARTVKVKATPVTDEHGVVQKMIGVDMDVTDINEAEKKLKESQHWLEETSKASPDAIIIYDLHKKQPVFLNNCLSEWTGKSLDELVSMGIEGRLQLIHRDDRLNLLHFNEKIAMAKDGDVLTLEYRIFSKEEQARWIRNRSKVFQRDAAGKVTHILSILQDVSEEKAAERLLKSLNTSLERQNRELEAKSDEITSFAFVASHDLKEPIRKIHTFSDWLLSRETNLSEGGKQSLTRLSNAVKRLDILVEDIVALTKVHVEKEDLHDVCLNVVLRRAKQEMQETLERSGAQIIAEQLPTVKGVENHLVYLFKNLLGNSIKFQQPGNQPVIHISAVSIDGFVKLIFTDNGIGFAPEYSKKVFQMFRRLHGKHEYEGTGMGLAICKRIMEKHGGNITAEGEKDNGATFTCWFPAS